LRAVGPFLKRLLPLLLLAAALSLRADEAPTPPVSAPGLGNPVASDLPTTATAREALSYGDAAILGIVEGITEYLPVSSTGHLILASRALGLEDERPVHTPDGALLWLEKPKADGTGGVPMTVKAATDTFVVVIQVGAIAAVVLLFFPYLWRMLQGLLGRDPKGLLLLRNVMLAVAPAVVAGLLLHDWIEEKLFSVPTVMAALVFGSLVMFGVEAWRRRRAPGGTADEGPELWQLNPAQCLLVGVLQCVAMWPGTSRSMMTIVGGYLAGLSPKRAAEFSFLVGLPTLAGASLLKGVKSGPAMIAVFGWGPVLVGFLIAAVSAALAVKWLVAFLQRHGLTPFAWYRLALAAVVGVFLLN
jgi:undecaprenyl-diphosphatase